MKSECCGADFTIYLNEEEGNTEAVEVCNKCGQVCDVIFSEDE